MSWNCQKAWLSLRETILNQAGRKPDGNLCEPDAKKHVPKFCRSSAEGHFELGGLKHFLEALRRLVGILFEPGGLKHFLEVLRSSAGVHFGRPWPQTGPESSHEASWKLL